MAQPAGLEQEQSLRSGGYTEQEIAQWKSDTRQDLQGAGFSGQEADDYFGVKNPDMKPTKDLLTANFKAAQAENDQKTTVPGTNKPPVSPADSFLEAIEAGFQISTSGLMGRQQNPSVVLPEKAPMAYRIAASAATLAGDVPAMIAGSLAGGAGGGAAGTAVLPGPGTAVGAVVGAGAGAFALPTAMRRILMDHYEKGDIQDFNDFWERASGTFIDTAKSAIVGGATAGVGGVVGKLGAGVLTPAAKTIAQATSEVGTMVTVGSALEGKVPDPHEFVDAAILVGGLHGVTAVSGKLRNIYAGTGVRPSETVEAARNDPLVKQDLISETPAPGELSPTKIPPRGAASRLTEEPKVPIEPADPVKKILSQVGEKVDPKGEGYNFRKAYKDIIDKYDPINQAIKALEAKPEILNSDENPYQLARMANDYKAKVKHIFENGTLDYETLATTGKSFQEILKPIAKDTEGFSAYIISKRALEVEAAGKVSGFDLDAAKETVKLGKAQFEGPSKELVDFQNRNLEYIRDAGIISKDTFKALVDANKSYVPFARIMDPEAAATGGLFGKPNPLKTFKGSEKQIQNPLISILENTQSLMKLAEKNRASVALVEMAENTEGQTLLKKVPSQTKATKISSDEVAKILAEHGIEGIDPEPFTMFARRTKQTLNENEFEVFRNGKREVWEAKNKDVAEAIRALDGDKASTNLFFKFARTITQIKKIGIAVTPEFILKNLFRDQLTAGTFSQGKALPFVDTLVAMKDIVGKNDNYYNWLKSGGASGTFLELDKNYLENNIFELNKDTGIIDKTWNTLKKPVDFIIAAGALSEQATRLAEFKAVSKGQTSGPEVFKGGFAAREVTVDFSRIGAKMSALNAVTAFQNVGMQGLDRTIRAIKEDPVGVTSKAAAYITVPSVLLWWANHDDERYKELPRWQKDSFWIIPTDKWVGATPEEAGSLPPYLVRQNGDKTEINKGVIFRVPKPQELGMLFGSLPERVLESYFTENPKAFKEFGQTMMHLVTPTVVQDIASPFIEQTFNKSLFTGTKIVPGYLEGIAPEYQYSDYTSETAKQLGKLVRTMPGVGKDTVPGKLSISSPMVIDNYVRAWSGSLGQYALQLADKALVGTGVVPDPVKPASTLADIPVIKAFVIRYPSASAQSIQDFYDRHAKNKVIVDTIHHLAKTGDFDNMEKELLLSQNQDKLINLEGVQKALTRQSQFIRLINKNPGYSASDKRQLIDGVYYGMIETARAGNQIMEALDKELKK